MDASASGIKKSNAQLDSLVLELNDSFECKDYMRLKLFKLPKKNLSINETSLQTIGLFNTHHMEFSIVLNIKHQAWWSIIEEFKGYLNHNSIFTQYKNKSVEINQLRYQFAHYHQLMTNQSLFLENCQLFIQFLAQNFTVFFYCKGIKYPIEKITDMAKLNALFKTSGKQSDGNRIDWSFNYFLDECSEKNVIFFGKVLKDNFPCNLLSNTFKSQYMNNLKLKKTEVFKYQFSIASSRTYKFRIFDKIDTSKVCEILFYYHNSSVFRNAAENRIKSVSWYEKLHLSKFRNLFINNSITLNDKLIYYESQSHSIDFLVPRVEVRCFNYQCVDEIFLYFEYLYNNELENVKKTSRKAFTIKFVSVIKFIVRAIRNCYDLKCCIILEEVLYIIFNGYHQSSSFLKPKFVKNLIKIIMEDLEREKTMQLCAREISYQMCSVGLHF